MKGLRVVAWPAAHTHLVSKVTVEGAHGKQSDSLISTRPFFFVCWCYCCSGRLFRSPKHIFHALLQPSSVNKVDTQKFFCENFLHSTKRFDNNRFAFLFASSGGLSHKTEREREDRPHANKIVLCQEEVWSKKRSEQNKICRAIRKFNKRAIPSRQQSGYKWFSLFCCWIQKCL